MGVRGVWGERWRVRIVGVNSTQSRTWRAGTHSTNTHRQRSTTYLVHLEVKRLSVQNRGVAINPELFAEALGVLRLGEGRQKEKKKAKDSHEVLATAPFVAYM